MIPFVASIERAGWPNRLLLAIGVRQGEFGKAAGLSGYLFLIVFCYLVLKAVRGALFIDRFGALKLPYVMVGIALLAGLCAGAYIRLARRFALTRILSGSLIFFAANLALFWIFARQGNAFLIPVLYIWIGVFGVIATTQVWTLANELLTTRQAKRLFGLIGTGGILGGTLGGIATGYLAPRIGAPQLLLVAAGLLLVAAVVVVALSKFATACVAAPAGSKAPRNLLDSLQRIRSSSHLTWLAALIMISAVATSSVDFQFSVMAEQHFSTGDQLASFFGTVYGAISLVSLFFQLFLTHRALRFLGVGVSVLLLPLSLLIGTAALFASGALWAGVVLKGSDGSLKHALDRSCRELLYLPVPQAIKIQTKSTIDTVMDRLGDGFAGILQLGLTAGLGFGLRGSLAVNFAILSIWAWIAVRIKREYIVQLREALGRVRGRFFSEARAEPDADMLRAVNSVLRHGEAEDRIAALQWSRVRGLALDESVLVGLFRDDPSEAVRRTAAESLLGPAGPLPPVLEDQLDEAATRTLGETIDILVEEDPENRFIRLEVLLGGYTGAQRLPVVAYTLRRLGSEFQPFVHELFDRLLSAEAPADVRVRAAQGLSFFAESETLLDRLPGLLADPDDRVASAAAASIGALGLATCAPRMVHSLARRGCRVESRRALRRIGTSAGDALLGAFADPEASPAVRKQLPALLVSLETQRAVAAVRTGLDDSDPAVAQACLRELAKLRMRRPSFQIPGADELERRIDRAALALQQARAALGPLPAEGWLRPILEEYRKEARVQLFDTLSLLYSPQELSAVREAIDGEDSRRRANALEWLDNRLTRSLKGQVIPALESESPIERWDLKQSLTHLCSDTPAWMASFAFHAAMESGVTGLEQVAMRRRSEAVPILQESTENYLALHGGSQ